MRSPFQKQAFGIAPAGAGAEAHTDTRALSNRLLVERQNRAFEVKVRTKNIRFSALKKHEEELTL